MSIGGDFNELVDMIEASEALDLGIDAADDLFLVEAVTETPRRNIRQSQPRYHNHQEQDSPHGSFYSFEDR